jgi:hypothetical protein
MRVLTDCFRCGRRPMSLLSGAIMAVCMTGLALYLHLVPSGELSSAPLVLLLVYVVRTACALNTAHIATQPELLSY